MNEFFAMARQGINRFDEFGLELDEHAKMKALPEVSSRALAAIADPLFVSGAVDKEDSNRLYFTVVGEHVSAKASHTPDGGPQVSAHPNSEIRSIEITSAPIVTSNVIGFGGRGDLEYVLRFAWGDVVVSRHMGNGDDRARWLEHFTTLLGGASASEAGTEA